MRRAIKMKRRIKEIIFLVLVFLQINTIYAAQFNPQHVVWDHVPINVVLPVGKERIIVFSEKVQFGYDHGVLSSDILQVQNNDGALYLLAKKSFTPQRVEVKLVNSGKVILLNLSAQADASDAPLSILVTSLAASQSAQTIRNDQDMPLNLDYPCLLRFAVQQLYAPERLLTKPNYIYRVPMRTSRTVSLFIGNNIGNNADNNIIAMPQISWRAGDLYVTAVILRNISKHSVYLNPKNLTGDWLAASLFPLRRLLPKNTLINGIPRDNTTLFLISKEPFGEALIGLKNV